MRHIFDNRSVPNRNTLIRLPNTVMMKQKQQVYEWVPSRGLRHTFGYLGKKVNQRVCFVGQSIRSKEGIPEPWGDEERQQ